VVLVGTSGYQFDDWIGTAYPRAIPRSKMIRYYSSVWQFNAVELNFTYYRMPTQKTIVGMLNKVTADPVVFSVKAYGDVTHKHWRTNNTEGLKTDTDEFINAISPMKDASRLAAVLFQFPSSFRPSEDSKRYLEQLAGLYASTNKPLAIEFRHRDWKCDETYQFLSSMDMVPVVVDEPQIGSLFPYTPASSRRYAYFRFHGRNRNWFRTEGSERYNYDYSEDELREFASDVLEFSQRGLQVYVFFNNCYMGRAVHNALSFRQMLGGE